MASDDARAVDPQALESARSSYAGRAWADAYAAFGRADAAAPLELADLQRWLWSAALIGRDAEMFTLSERLHREQLEAGALTAAANLGIRAGSWSARPACTSSGCTSCTRCPRE